MVKLKSLVTGALLGAGGMYVGLQYHLLQAEEGFLIVPRTPQQRLQDTYADIRDWDAATWIARPQVALAVTEHGRGDLITEDATSHLLESLRESIDPLRKRLNEPSQGWEPSATTRIPSAGEASIPQRTREERSSEVDSARPRHGFLPLAELFGVDEQPQASAKSSTILPADSAVTPILPAGTSQSKQVEILPSPGEFEILREPDDVELGPSAPIPGSKHSMDRRRSDATTGWQPLTVKSF